MTATSLPKGFLNRETVNKRISLYQMSQQSELPEGFDVPVIERNKDTKWVWYSKEQVQTWLNEIMLYKGDGLRIYFGRKEKNDTAADDDHKNSPSSGQLCLIFLPTREGLTKDSHINIIYETEENYQERLAQTPVNQKGINAGGYCPPMTIVEGPDYPDDSLS
jgi:hypothetical protein